MNQPNFQKINQYLYLNSEVQVQRIISSKVQRINRMRLQLLDARQRAENQREIINEKNEEIERLHGRLADKQSALSKKNAEIQELRKRLADKQIVLSKKDAEIEGLSKKLSAQKIILSKNNIGQSVYLPFKYYFHTFGDFYNSMIDPKEEARQRGLQQKLMETAQVKVWSDLEKQKYLQVTGSGLLELPTKLCLLTQLKGLYFMGNELKFLPENIGALKELGQLLLYQNQLTKLPESLGNLSKLHRLEINDNPNLKELPKSFKNLKELHVLGIDWQLLPKQNIFKTEPFASLKDLQTLWIYNLDSDGNQRKEAIKKECEQNKIQVYFY